MSKTSFSKSELSKIDECFQRLKNINSELEYTRLNQSPGGRQEIRQGISIDGIGSSNSLPNISTKGKGHK